MHVSLMADVPDELVLWKIVHIMQRQRDLDDAEIWREMAAVFGADLDQPRPDLFGQGAQLVHGHIFYIFGLDVFQHSPVPSFTKRRLRLFLTVHDVVGDVMEHIAIAWQPCQTFLSKAALLLGHGAGSVEAVERWVGGFFVLLIAADRLADDGFVADDVDIRYKV